MVILYKRTIIASSVIAIAFVLGAIICEMIVFPHNLLLQNFMVGIACSLLVVIITTILQYNHEHKRVFSDYVASLRKLILHLSFVYPDLEDMHEEETYNKLYHELDQSFESLVNWDEQLVWFSADKKKKQEKTKSLYTKMWMDFTKGFCKSKESAVLALVRHPNYLQLIEAAKDMLSDKIDRKLIDMCLDVATSVTQEKTSELCSEASESSSEMKETEITLDS